MPGVAAMFSPRWNGLVSTCRGRPLLCTRSSRKLRAPATRLAPPVSNARFSAAGLVTRKLVGLNASSMNPAASRALPSLTGSPRPTVEYLVSELPARQVELAQGSERRVVLPGGVGEPLVAVRLDRRSGLRPDRLGRRELGSPGQVGGQPDTGLGQGDRMLHGPVEHREQRAAEARHVEIGDEIDLGCECVGLRPAPPARRCRCRTLGHLLRNDCAGPRRGGSVPCHRMIIRVSRGITVPHDLPPDRSCPRHRGGFLLRITV